MQAINNRLLELQKILGAKNRALFPIEITPEKLRKVANYLNDKEPFYNDIEAWKVITKGNYYAYSVFLHELVEIERYEGFLETGKIRNFYKDTDVKKIRIQGHGAALLEQYKFLRKYLLAKGIEKESVAQLCFHDVWNKNGSLDFDNTGILLHYLKGLDPLWYNNEVMRATQPDEALRLLMDEIREEES